jgi:predicted kinase
MQFQELVENVLIEGEHDKNRFKAIFVLGPPGAGKSYVTRNYISDGTLKIIDNDIATVHLLKKHGLRDSSNDLLDFRDLSPEDDKKLKDIRDKAWQLTGGSIGDGDTSPYKGLLHYYVEGGLGLIYSGSGADTSAQKIIYDFLVKNGYDVMCVVVTAPLGMCLQGNRDRDRKVKDQVIIDKHCALENNIPFYQELFKDRFIIFNNTGRGSTDPQEAKELKKTVQKFLQS